MDAGTFIIKFITIFFLIQIANRLLNLEEYRLKKESEKKKFTARERRAIEKESDEILEYTAENNAFGIKLKDLEKGE